MPWRAKRSAYRPIVTPLAASHEPRRSCARSSRALSLSQNLRRRSRRHRGARPQYPPRAAAEPGPAAHRDLDRCRHRLARRRTLRSRSTRCDARRRLGKPRDHSRLAGHRRRSPVAHGAVARFSGRRIHGTRGTARRSGPLAGTRHRDDAGPRRQRRRARTSNDCRTSSGAPDRGAFTRPAAFAIAPTSIASGLWVQPARSSPRLCMHKRFRPATSRRSPAGKCHNESWRQPLQLSVEPRETRGSGSVLTAVTA